MSIPVNKEERDFLESGGALWCVRELPAGWQAVMLRWESEEPVYGLLPSEWHAVRLVYLLHDLSTPQTGFWPPPCHRPSGRSVARILSAIEIAAALL